MANKPNWQAISKYRSYSVDEAARALGVNKKTVRRWIKAGLPILDNCRPSLVHGPALIRLGNKRKKKRHTLLPGEFLCFGCKEPRTAANGEAWIHDAAPHSVLMMAECLDCGTRMFRRASLRSLAANSTCLRLRAPQAIRDLIQSSAPCLNVHFEREATDHAKATPKK